LYKFTDSDKSASVNTKKKKKIDSNDTLSGDSCLNGDLSVFDMSFPKSFEPEFATSIFELGLKHSSPKVLMSLMPLYTNLHSEHLKSHLQKYRIHHERSKDEFLAFYNEYMRDTFQQWEDSKGWERKGCGHNENKLVEKQSTIPLIDITTAANSIQNTDKMSASRSSSSSSSSASAGYTHQVDPQTSQPVAKKTKSLSGYKNIVLQASQLVSEWQNLYEGVVVDTGSMNPYGNQTGAFKNDPPGKGVKGSKSGKQVP
jgi:hypothetical protein